MKYEAPRLEKAIIEAEDIITASNGVEINETSENSGEALINIINLFK